VLERTNSEGGVLKHTLLGQQFDPRINARLAHVKVVAPLDALRAWHRFKTEAACIRLLHAGDHIARHQQTIPTRVSAIGAFDDILSPFAAETANTLNGHAISSIKLRIIKLRSVPGASEGSVEPEQRKLWDTNNPLRIRPQCVQNGPWRLSRPAERDRACEAPMLRGNHRFGHTPEIEWAFFCSWLLFKQSLDFHFTPPNAVCFIPMQFYSKDQPVWESRKSKSLEFSPSARTKHFAKIVQFANPPIHRDHLDI
jgi:hypothetical protein